jgi:molecular chaperone GrpE
MADQTGTPVGDGKRHDGERQAERPPRPDAGADARAQVAEAEERCGQAVAEAEDRWRRAVADLDNLRKRVARDAERVQGDERARVAAQWLPVVDNLELALEHAEADPAAIVDGVRGVRDQAVEVLSRLGFARRTDEGMPFDPGRHEAVAVLPAANAPAGTVLHVVRPGYGNDERQLRPAAVVVAKGD